MRNHRSRGRKGITAPSPAHICALPRRAVTATHAATPSRLHQHLAPPLSDTAEHPLQIREKPRRFNEEAEQKRGAFDPEGTASHSSMRSVKRLSIYTFEISTNQDLLCFWCLTDHWAKASYVILHQAGLRITRVQSISGLAFSWSSLDGPALGMMVDSCFIMLFSLIGCGTGSAVAAAQGTETITANPKQLQPKQHVWQESNAKVLEALKEIQSEHATIKRDGQWSHGHPACDLVPGDIIELLYNCDLR
ncbi:unnamed protein product [Miscanthus lutarioriparius]|uniref:Uncharacterized protein n=1 Tax=Miscanthus lutarioriparius TaxID=422564 RepID=A0A811SCY5_9POAL|nr:unnamed protein product [Miscanthus lutarioriparius]